MRPSKTGSDGSVHKNENVAAAAWIIPTNEQEFVKACYLMTNVSSVNSYRAELEGVFRSLYHMQYLGMDPEETVTQWFDNESGVQTSNRAPVTGKDMMQPEADLLLAIHHLKSKLAFNESADMSADTKIPELGESKRKKQMMIPSLQQRELGFRPSIVRSLLMRQNSTLHVMNWQGQQLQER
jgi:hypothetical protein